MLYQIQHSQKLRKYDYLIIWLQANQPFDECLQFSASKIFAFVVETHIEAIFPWQEHEVLSCEPFSAD